MRHLFFISILTLFITGCDNNRYDLFSSSSPDIWQQVKSGFMMKSYDHHPVVKAQIRFYENHPHILTQAIEPAKYYLPYILREVKKRKLPTELALLPIVESSYNPFAHSRAGASGLWQMMPGTASNLRVKINYWYDGRRDLIESTNAALDHLTRLHAIFNDWSMAIAAYDAGAGRVKRARKHFINKYHTSPDFFSLNLPQETMGYVPKLLAIKSIISRMSNYGIALPEIDPQIQFATIQTNSQIKFSELAHATNVSLKEIRLLNAGYRRPTTAPDTNNTILVPTKMRHKTIKYLSRKSIHTSTHYRIIKGDTLSSISRKNNIRLIDLQKANPNLGTLKIGQSIEIPSKIIFNEDTRDMDHKHISADFHPGPTQLIYHIRPGETLNRISQKFGIPKAHIVYWNHLKASKKLETGQKVILWINKKPLKHKIKPGDTIIAIAKKYRVQPKEIKRLNNMRDNLIKAGQYIEIP